MKGANSFPLFSIRTGIPYSAKFLWVFSSFAQFTNFQLFAKYFKENFWHVNYSFHMQEYRWQHPRAMLLNMQGHSPKRCLQSTHCFADSHAHTTLRCGVCAWFRQRIRELFQQNLQKLPFAKKLDPRKFSAVQYYFGFTYIGKQLNLSRLQVASG